MPIAMNRSLRLPEGEFFSTPETKTGIAIHHTVGDSARSTFDWWQRDRARDGSRVRVGTAFIIDRDGTVFEVFDPRAWAFQFGLPWPDAKRRAFEKRFIGIELASEGALIEREGNLYCFDRISPRTLKNRAEAFDFGRAFRGYRYFDRYEAIQVATLIALINELCTTFDIPRRVPSGFLDFYGEALKDFRGIIGHTMVRRDKTDPLPDLAFWQAVVDGCGLAPVQIG